MIRGVLVALALGSFGCAGRFDVAPSPRVQVLSTAGRGAIAKNGYVASVGRYGDGLDWAVKGVPAAEREASIYRGELVSAEVMSFAGVAAMLSGIGVEAAGLADQGSEADPAKRPAGDRAGLVAAFAFTAGLGGVIAAGILREHAKVHITRAADLYNATLR